MAHFRRNKPKKQPHSKMSSWDKVLGNSNDWDYPDRKGQPSNEEIREFLEEGLDTGQTCGTIEE